MCVAGEGVRLRQGVQAERESGARLQHRRQAHRRRSVQPPHVVRDEVKLCERKTTSEPMHYCCFAYLYVCGDGNQLGL